MTHQSAKPYDEKWSSRLRASAASFTLVSLGAVVYLVTSGNLHDSKWLLALAGLAAFVSATTFVLAGSISEWALRSQALLALGLGWMVISGTGAHLVDKGTSPAILLVLLPLIAGSLFFSPWAVLVCIVGALGTGFVVATTGGSTQAGGTPFTTDDVFFVTLITAGIGVFVMAASGIRSLLERQVRELSGILGQVARTDPLTGCLDRRSFAERLRSEVKRAERYTQSLSLALIDVDRLTSINEKFGRETGDDFLAALGGLLRGWSRSTDVIGRIGGDEFAVLMPHTDPSAAAVHMHHIQERSKRIGNGHMSLSIGISGLDAARPRPEQIRRDAERALYTVKHTRKGDIVLGSPSDLCEEDFQTRRHAPSLTKIGSEESAARTIR